MIMEKPDIVNDKVEESSIVNQKLKELDAVYDKIEEPIFVPEKMAGSNTVYQKIKNLDEIEGSNAINNATSDVEDLDISETEEVSRPDDIPLNIDCNARVVTKDVMCDSTGDDCDMQFVERSSVYLLSPDTGSEPCLHTSTEDLNMSDDEQSCVTALKSINLDGLASTSSKKGANSLSASNFSHTVFKDEFSFEAEYLSDEEIRGALQEKSGGEDKLGQLCPGLKLEGLLLTFRPPPSFFSPTQDISESISVNNVSPSSMVDISEKHDLDDDQGSPSKTCFDLTKSEYSDGHNTDAEDISFGSLDDIIESAKIKNPFGKVYNAFSLPETVSEFSHGNINDERHLNSGDSRRSSAAGFLTEDETLTFENFSDCEKKRFKAKDCTVSDKNENSEDSLTDEEVIEEQ